METSDLPIRSTEKDFLIRAVDLARVLKISDNEISRLTRSSVLSRVRDPKKRSAFLYPCLANVTAYVLHHRGKREELHHSFLQEKAGRERAIRLKVEAFNRQQAGELVDKRKLIDRLEPIVVAFREQLLARAERLERSLVQTKSRKDRVKRIRNADLESLGVLSDLFKVVSPECEDDSNGATR